MEGDPNLYQQEAKNKASQFSYYNVVTWALFASFVLTVVNAFSEAYSRDPRADSEAARLTEFQDQWKRSPIGLTKWTTRTTRPQVCREASIFFRQVELRM